MQAYIRATHHDNSQDSLANNFPAVPGKKAHSKKAEPEHKNPYYQKSDQNLRDHGNSYQTDHLNSDMQFESLGSRSMNPNREADGFFSPQDLIRKHAKGKDQEERKGIVEERSNDSNDVNPEIARRRLAEFSLKNLPRTKAGKFDMRSRDVNEYLSLCVSADVDAYKYYDENINKEPEPVVHKGPQKLGKGGKDQAALRELKSFSLESLKWTQNNTLDMRVNSCKEFVALCEAAGVDPLQYFLQNFSDEKEQETQSIREQPKSPEKSLRPVYQPNNGGLQREESDREAALRKLRDFPLNELQITKKNLLDMRRNNSKDFLMLCDNAGVDPMEYYFEHVENPNYNMNSSVASSNSMRSSTRSVNLTDSSLTLTKDSKLDKRYSTTKDFIQEKVSEAEMRLSQFDTSKLKRRKDGELDKRVKANQEYLELQEQTQESYWQNMKFHE